MTTFRRKVNRLPPASYSAGIYFVTANCQGRAAYFADSRWARFCEEHLLAQATRARAELLAYTVMPDHFHALVATPDSHLSFFMKAFKQTTAFHFKRKTGQQLWQKSYYDHVVRNEEDLAGIALYIAANPVRRGLVEDWEEYAFTGGSLLARSEDPVPAAPGDLKVATTITATQGDAR